MFGRKGRARRAERKQARQDNRAQRKADRRQSRADRIDQRQQGRTERAGIRSETKQTAYEAGINPNQFISDGLQAAGDVGEAYFDAKKSMFGTQPAFDGTPTGAQTGKKMIPTAESGGESFMPIALAGLGAMLLFKK